MPGRERTLGNMRTGVVLLVAAVSLRALQARLPGWDPESLWKDDLVWGAIARAQDLTTVLTVPAHSSPGFFAVLWVMRRLFGDPEWPLQLLPFFCGIAAIPVMAMAVFRLTERDELALLAAALTALNPLLVHYSVFVKEYSLGFLVTASLLLSAASLLRDAEPEPRRFARFSILAGGAVFISVPSVFASFPIVNLGALRLLWARTAERVRAISLLLAAAAYDLLVLLAYLVLRSRTNEVVQGDFSAGFMPLHSLGGASLFLKKHGRRLLETSLPSWRETPIWNPETVPWLLPLVGLGMVWLLAQRSLRAFGYAALCFYGIFFAASCMWIYPLGIGRTDIFAFPVAIILFAAGIHLVTEWMPKPEIVRLMVGLGAAGFALYRPIPANYWRVDDAHLVECVTAMATPEDGLILSADGAFLVSHYGKWPVVISGANHRSHGTRAEIVRDLTIYLPSAKEPRAAIERFLNKSRPRKVWYVAYRTGQAADVLKVLEERGYVTNEVKQTRKGRLYLGVDQRARGP